MPRVASSLSPVLQFSAIFSILTHFNGIRVSFNLDSFFSPYITMNLSLPSPSTFRGNLVVPLSRCTSCFQFNLRFHRSNRFRNLRWSSGKLSLTGRRRIACSVTESDGDKEEVVSVCYFIRFCIFLKFCTLSEEGLFRF